MTSNSKSISESGGRVEWPPPQNNLLFGLRGISTWTDADAGRPRFRSPLVLSIDNPERERGYQASASHELLLRKFFGLVASTCLRVSSFFFGLFGFFCYLLCCRHIRCCPTSFFTCWRGRFLSSTCCVHTGQAEVIFPFKPFHFISPVQITP